MYSQEDSLRNKKLINRWLIILLIIFLLFSIAISVTLAFRIMWATIVTTCILCTLMIFLLDLKFLPLVRYQRFLNDVRKGLSRTVTAKFLSLENEAVQRDGVLFYPMTVTIGNKEEDLRLYYYDESKPRPTILAGETVTITSFGNFVTELKGGLL